ncbi:MAG TPA: D-amino acid dehydrogenase [Steroidobacteraceae bacterium]|jgi:D-amino-acid dehydrogenase
MTSQRIAVIGGGLAGITTAYELVRRGFETVVYEAREDVARETSYANGAMLTPAMSDPWNAPGVYKHLAASLFNSRSPMKLRLGTVPSMFTWGLRFLRNSTAARHDAATQASYRLARHSLECTRALREQLGLQYDAAARGALKLFHSQAGMQGPLAMARRLEPLGLRFEVLDRDATVQAEPELEAIRDRISGALYFPDDESGDALKFCEALTQVIVKSGGIVRTGTCVSSIAVERGKVIGVVIDQELHQACAVVVAAGNATPQLVRRLGITLPIQPAKGYTLTFDISHLERRPLLSVIDDALHAAVVPLNARLRVAGTAEFAGMDKTLHAERVENLLALLGDIYPHIAAAIDRRHADVWAALRPMSADGLPFIGPTRVPGLFVNAGHGHLGWTLAAGSANLLADLISRQEPAVDPGPYRATR